VQVTEVCWGRTVLSRELELFDLDARHWRHWWQLLVPPRVLGTPERRPRWALAVIESAENLAPIKVVVAGAGALHPAPPLPGLDEAALLRWAQALDVDAVIVLERHIVARLSQEIERALRYDQDLVEQALVALRALKRHAHRGVWTAPAVLELIPPVPYDGLQRTFDLLVPDRSALVGYVIDDDRRAVHASIIAVKRGGDIALATTHRAIDDTVREAALARQWDKHYDHVLDAVEARFAKPAIGVFLERATLHRILVGPSDQLARELNAKRVVIDPAPAWLLGLLGGATVAAMATRGARALAQMLPAATRERAAGLAQRAGAAIRESGPFAQLGFDPIELWSRLRQFYRP
jgi:hypothetical protein